MVGQCNVAAANKGKGYSREDLIAALLDPRMKTFAFAGIGPCFPEAVQFLRGELLKYVTAESTVVNVIGQRLQFLTQDFKPSSNISGK